MFMKGNFIQIKEASELLGVTKLTLRNWDKAKKLTSYRHPINNYRVYNKKDIYNLLDQIKNNKSPILKKGASENRVYKLKVIHVKD